MGTKLDKQYQEFLEWQKAQKAKAKPEKPVRQKVLERPSFCTEEQNRRAITGIANAIQRKKATTKWKAVHSVYENVIGSLQVNFGWSKEQAITYLNFLNDTGVFVSIPTTGGYNIYLPEDAPNRSAKAVIPM